MTTKDEYKRAKEPDSMAHPFTCMVIVLLTGAAFWFGVIVLSNILLAKCTHT